MDAAAELGRNPLSKHHIQPEYGGEQADANGTAKPVSRNQCLHTYIHTYIHACIQDQCEWHRMTKMTGPDCAVMCNLINIYTYMGGSMRVA